MIFEKVMLLLVALCCFTVSGRRSNRHKTKKSTIPQESHSLEHYMPWKEVSKKSLIEHGVVNVAEHKQKRGFLANLANLLTDAETISGHKGAKNAETGLSSYTLAPQKSLLEKESDANNRDSNNVETSQLSKNINPVKKENIDLNSAKEITDAVADSGKEYAPIFAMYHGKLVTLGKLPDTAFKRSHTSATEQQSMSSDISTRETNVKDVTGTKRYLPDSNSKTAEQLTKRDSQFDTAATLQEYLKNLDTGSKDTTRGVTKDEVPFPSIETGTSKSDILGHVKGVVLDNGKVVSVTNNHIESDDAPVKQHTEDLQRKYYVTNDGNVEPLVKSKPEAVEAVTRDNLLDGVVGNQKTVTLTVDVLKDLLKKTDSKVSLASLLNKPAETKSDTPEADEDPGTIEDFAAGGLKAHNTYRAKHHDDTLIWADDLAAKAQKLAEALADGKTLEIAKDLEKEGMGENVAKVWATFKNAGEAATKMWYTQSGNYRFDDPHLDENTGQFAQVVWKSTKELGMGVAKSIDDVNNKYVYVTALYRPPGNIEATLRENVLPTSNNTVDVYSTFFKRTGVVSKDYHIARRSKIQRHKNKIKVVNIIDDTN